ncbi:hypothetical protein [Oryza sativa Japonica Group]|uniref:Uncharacterized protein n=1 Tax=Oryza sativa subsp. japonica TaxID=39947 RepID=Q5VQK6_ORYSJ|nr:hypothetical protein [Oryza sativa Japonica Group]BAD68279.1 hypothetical protein [Oryza sativa Japonica Group]
MSSIFIGAPDRLLHTPEVCLLVVMASSSSWTVQGRPLALESVPACCFYHPDCCQAAGADPAIADP